MRQKENTDKYLSRYAEATAAWLAQAELGDYRSGVVVPAFNESAHFLDRLLSQQRGHEARLILTVVNHPPDASPAQKQASYQLLRRLREQGGDPCAHFAPPLSLHRGLFPHAPGLDVLAIDATTPELCLQEKEGVGRARKMGFDALVALYHRGKILSRMAGSTDADVCLPQDYFQKLEESYIETASALLFPYRHVQGRGQKAEDFERMRLIEAEFRYYVLGLAFAQSPYAYHSLGSALAVSLPHYVQARGVPNRQAGEDFYLLSKLGKLGPIVRLASQSIKIDSRLSARVPFGTGRSLERSLQSGVQFDSPEVFLQLKIFIAEMETRARAYCTAADEAAREPDSRANEITRSAMSRYHKRLLGEWPGCPSAQHRVARFHQVFDALATRQFIHRQKSDGILPGPWSVTLPLALELGLLPLGTGLPSLCAAESELPRLVGAATA